MYNANSLFLSSAGGYNISRSLRFNDNDSAYLDRTPSSSGNRRTFTFSCWCKRSNIGSFATLFASSDGSDFFKFQFRDDNRFEINTADGGSDTTQLITTDVFRDVSAWYHIVIAFDTTQGDASNRVKMYVNNRQITSFDNTTRPSQNQQHAVNHNIEHQIGNQVGNTRYFDGYMAEINHVDGQQLEPSSFGKYHPITGAWVPQSYSGSHGTNGFYLNFSDNSNNTAATLGKDSSGSNNFTPNNFSVSAGQGNDSLEDTPTNNWCTLNPLHTSDVSTYSNGNLDVVCNNASTAGGTIAVKSGKWYAEVVCTAKTATNAMIGVCTVDGFDGDRQLDESQNGGSGTGYVMNGTKLSGGASYGATWAVDDVMGIALDLDSAQNTVTFYKNGSSQGSIDIDNAYYVFCSSNGQGSSTVTYSWNFGQRAFSYSIPSGHLELNTKNLSTPIIADGRKHFNTVLFTGNGSTQSVTGVGFQPDWTWIKNRSDGSRGHALFDSARGGTERLDSSATQEGRTNEGNISFQSDGFNVTSSHPTVNDSSDTAVAWNWKVNGGTTSSNTDGTIISTVQVNANAGFSIVLYSGAGATATVGHGLGVAPKTIFVKGRTNTDHWFVYNKNLPNPTTGYLYLNQNSAEVTGANPWGGNAADSSVFTVANDGGVGSSGNDYVAYCFAEVEGYSKFGSFTGNGSSDGPFVYCGFRPAFMIVKVNDSAYNWLMYDLARSTNNPSTYVLFPNLDDSESQSTDHFDWLSNGFKLRGDSANPSGTTVFFWAFAKTPFKYATAV